MTVVGIQIVRVEPRRRGQRTHWRIAAFRPDNGTLDLFWLGANGWLPADGRQERRWRRFGTEAAARRVLATL